MTNRTAQQADDIHALLAEMAQHSRRKRAEKWLGPITIYATESYTYHFRFEAYFDRYLDIDMPAWARAFGQTEAEAIRALLDGAEDEIAEREEARHNDEMFQNELQRRARCNEL